MDKAHTLLAGHFKKLASKSPKAWAGHLGAETLACRDLRIQAVDDDMYCQAMKESQECEVVVSRSYLPLRLGLQAVFSTCGRVGVLGPIGPSSLALATFSDARRGNLCHSVEGLAKQLWHDGTRWAAASWKLAIPVRATSKETPPTKGYIL